MTLNKEQCKINMKLTQAWNVAVSWCFFCSRIYARSAPAGSIPLSSQTQTLKELVFTAFQLDVQH